MTREEVFEKLNEVFRDVFEDDDITVEDATTAADVDGWDSLAETCMPSGAMWRARRTITR